MEQEEDEQAALYTAIEQVYAAFAGYPLRHPVVGCPCCVSRADQEPIASNPLRRLDSADLERYVWKSMSTWGDADDFLHFLPRVLELICDVRERGYLPDLFIVFSKLSHVGTWPEPEQQAIRIFLLAFWRWLLAGPPDQEGTLFASSYLEALTYALDDLTPFLTIWHTIRAPSSLRQLAELVTYHSWGSSLARHHQIRAWLRADETLKMLEDGFYAHMDEDWAESLAQAIEVLEWLRPPAHKP